MKQNKKIEKVANRDRHVDFRVNDEEYAIGLKNAEACGLSVSEYSRRRFIGNEPKLHLTEREIEAYKSLSDARGDLVHIRSALKGKTQERSGTTSTTLISCASGSWLSTTSLCSGTHHS